MRLNFFCVVILTIFSVCVTSTLGDESGSNEQGDKLKVAVYYETLCGDSKRFIKTQLYPVKKSTLGEQFDVELVPYGKATTTPTSDSYTFSCQHGHSECEGNKMHACALKYINSTELQLEFIYCSMSASKPPQTLQQCATQLNINPEEISECAEGREGSRLLNLNGVKTHALSPTLYFVPWITYDGQFSDDKLQQSQNSFRSVVCSELENKGVSVAECASSDSSQE